MILYKKITLSKIYISKILTSLLNKYTLHCSVTDKHLKNERA